FRDAWAIGINGKYVVGVWVGNADGEGRPGLVGVSAAAPLMFDVLSRLDGEILSDPQTAETIEEKICEQSGFRAGPYCEDFKLETVPQSTAKSEVCSFHYSLHLDQSEIYQVNSSCYPIADMITKSWFILPPVQAWYYRQYHTTYEEAPDFIAGCEETGEKNILNFIYPKNHSKIFIPRELNGQLGKVVFEVAHKDRQQTIYWHLDGEYLGKTTRPHQMGISDQEGEHDLYIIDELGNSQTLKFELLNK
ncbi:MAG: penicillin-binding protein 1C, partial [Reichenbachiella sp.]